MSRLVVCVVLALAACASPQRLSASIYEHEQRAYALDARGEYVAAAAERRDATHERARLGGMKLAVMGRENW